MENLGHVFFALWRGSAPLGRCCPGVPCTDREVQTRAKF
jgi:hypothetical protein